MTTDPLVEELRQDYEQIKEGLVPKNLILFTLKIWDYFPRTSNKQAIADIIDLLYQNLLDSGYEDDSIEIGFVNITFASVSTQFSRFEETIAYAFKAVKAFEKYGHDDGLGSAYLYLGVAYRSLGDENLALKYCFQAVTLTDPQGDFGINRAVACYQMAELCIQTKEYHQAIEYYHETIEVTKINPNEGLTIRAINGLGNAYKQLKDYDKALEFLIQAQQQANGSQNVGVEARCLTDLGNFYFEKGDFDKARQHHQKSLELRFKHQIRNGAITSLIHLAEVNIRCDELKIAEIQLLKGLEIAEELKVKAKLYQIHFLLSDMYEKSSRFDKAMQHYKIYHSLQTEVMESSSERKVNQLLQLKEAEITQKENEIYKKVNKELREQKEQIERQKNEIAKEKQKSDELLLNILPYETARELKEKGVATPRHYHKVTVLFTDFKGFTQLAEKLPPKQIITELHDCFTAFDDICKRHNIEKIKTIGDAYMAAGGIPVANHSNPIDVVKAGLEMQTFMKKWKAEKETQGLPVWELRLGVHTGELVAGVVGKNKFAYDIWGDTVNLAARMESSGEVGKVNISEDTYQLIQDHFECECRGRIKAKNKGEVEMYFVEGLKDKK